MHGFESHAATQLVNLAQLGAIAATVGWLAERTLNTGVSTRGLPLLAGLFGIYLGSHAWFLNTVEGPMVAGQALFPALAGAFAVCSFLKLANLGLAAPRW
jgi:hypothetical protein